MNTNDSTLSTPCYFQPGKAPPSGRGSKGLKVLSAKVRNIVRRNRQASYKEVAEILVTDNYLSKHGGASLTAAGGLALTQRRRD